MNDNEILELFSSSPKKAYVQIIEQYGNLVYAISANKLNKCATSEDIEDCTSDIFVEVFRSLESFSLARGTLKGFISTIAKRSAIDAYRRLAYRQSVTDCTDITETNLTTDDDVEETVMNNISRQNVRNAVMLLKEPERSIIIHQYYYNHTIREIADILSMTVGAVQQRSLRARKRIEKILEKG